MLSSGSVTIQFNCRTPSSVTESLGVRGKKIPHLLSEVLRVGVCETVKEILRRTMRSLYLPAKERRLRQSSDVPPSLCYSVRRSFHQTEIMREVPPYVDLSRIYFTITSALQSLPTIPFQIFTACYHFSCKFLLRLTISSPLSHPSGAL